MKMRQFTSSLLATLLLAIVVTAQQVPDQSDPKNLVVVDHTWRKEYVVPAVDSNPLRPNEDLIRQTRAEKAVIRQRDYELPNQTTEIPMPLPAGRPVPPAAREIYVYKITVKNSGAKRIKAVDWEFQFLNPETQEVMGTKQIISKVKLAPGKTQVIKAHRPEPPTHIVSAGQLDKKLQDQFKEKVIIHRIEYTDGTVWRRQP